ncbi:MAG: TolC family outer membrane protein [Pseudomonadota bacterium]
MSIDRWRGLRRVTMGLTTASVVALVAANGAQAQSLLDVLVATYDSNPTLAAQREAVRGSNEAIAQALAAYRPSVSADASIAGRWTQDQGDIDSSESINPATIGITIEQPLYSFGREAGVNAANFSIEAARANYVGTEQSVLLNAVTAYVDVVQDQALLGVAINNENVLRRQLLATQDRFEVGEVTRTDVAQAQASVAGAVALVVQNRGSLEDSRATFAQVVGFQPGDLTQPDVPVGLPTSLEEAIILAEARNPSVLGAEFTQQAASEQIEVEEGDLLPSFAVVGSARSTQNPSEFLDRRDTAEIQVQMVWQLYQGGFENSQVRQQRYLAGQRNIEIDETRRSVVADTITAWENLATARANISSFRSQVSANAIALEGVQQEALVGTRTVLDVLDAEQAVLDSRSSLIQAQRDEIVAAYSLLAQVGLMTAADLQLPVTVYDFGPDYERTRDRWFGNSIDD